MRKAPDSTEAVYLITKVSALTGIIQADVDVATSVADEAREYNGDLAGFRQLDDDLLKALGRYESDLRHRRVADYAASDEYRIFLIDTIEYNNDQNARVIELLEKLVGEED